MTLPWKDRTQYQVHIETLELAARTCVDATSAARIRALSPAPYPEQARLHPVASESTDDIAGGKRILFSELKEGFEELARHSWTVSGMKRDTEGAWILAGHAVAPDAAKGESV